jgi:hypothetical protein
MTSVAETIRTVCDLLGQLPGVAVQSSEALGDRVRTVIRVAGEDAIGAVQFIAGSANVDVEPCFRNPEQNASVEQILDAKFRKRDDLKFGELQILGIHCVWRLHKIGIISRPVANELLLAWGAAQVGA